MKILHINSVCGVTGTGRIVADLYDAAINDGHQCMIAYGEHKFHNNPGERQTIEIGSMTDCRVHAAMTRIVDAQGFGSRSATRRFLQKVEEYQPDVIHLHNLHGYYINIELLFQYLKTKRIKTVWTLHDCWSFTGHCVHFQEAGCDKWRQECGHCPLKRQYPSSIGLDRSTYNFHKKKALFTGIKDMTILVPSHWMQERVRQSFLKDYPIRVIYNGIDLETFHPIDSDFRTKYHLEDKFIILGVANIWVERKGLAVFLKLAELLGNEYQIVLVGLSQEQIKELPENILGFARTDTPVELAAVYTAADVFVNPSKEETFGLTVAEAMACGTWPIVYADTACAEVVQQGRGHIVADGIRELEQTIRLCKEKGVPAGIEKAAQIFSKERFGKEILAVYDEDNAKYRGNRGE